MIADAAELEHALSRWQTGGLSDEAQIQSARALAAAAEEIVAAGLADSIAPELWHEYLRQTGKTRFLRRMPDRDGRARWAETCFDIIRISNFSLLQLFEQRLREHPDRVLFQDSSTAHPGRWTYRAIARQVREIAAAFYTLAAPAEPRVALFTDNCAAGACSDLACLFYDILDTPLNVHFSAEVLSGIFARLGINIVVTDTRERRRMLEELRQESGLAFHIVALDAALLEEGRDAVHLGEVCKRFSEEQVASILAGRRRKALQEVATVMFTSGSTGSAKGVSFSIYSLVTKRFARAAALPLVGGDEVLLCYLPLFHTFGRYLEMLGTIYWGGTYVFVGNPSAETLLALLPRINPTGLISIPLRWVQLQERCMAGMSRLGSEAERRQEFRRLTGNRLRWGLSAAGYLDSKVFQFFQRHGVDLCSGFGMTEATGGITMTPPGEYVDDTNGLPLPGVVARFTPIGELQISGPYVARYLDDAGPGDLIPYPTAADDAYWLSTGDLFRVLPNGYYQIVDRVKDIYKNDKGQTVAPHRVEKAFEGVPGIKRTFLVGDHRAYNVLLIVPDEEDPVLKTCPGAEERREYFRRIVAAANRDIAPYERVVNFTLVDRDFTVENDELTAKGTFKRRTIEKNFASHIEELYRSNSIHLTVGALHVRIPRWFYRDLGILEDEILVRGNGLWNRSAERALALEPGSQAGRIRVGDLEYAVSGRVVDLGLFVRQPRLWIGNPALAAFYPCREGWDVSLGALEAQPLRPKSGAPTYRADDIPQPGHIKEQMLATVHASTATALFAPPEQALQALGRIGELLAHADIRWNEVLRTRLEALATHPEERLRCTAYKMLLLDDPTPDYGRAFPAFLESGLSFLNEESIQAIATSRLEKQRLEALRRRLLQYRTRLSWPADAVMHRQLRSVFRLLADFAANNPEFFDAVRSELAAWILHRADPVLSRSAEETIRRLKRRFDRQMAETTPVHNPEEWDRRLVFDYGLSPTERERVASVVTGHTFLRQSIVLAFDEWNFDLEQVPDGGIWISRIPVTSRFRHYRVCVNTRTAKHFDLELVLGPGLREESVMETVYWQLELAGWPFGPPVLSRMGCYDPRIGAMSVVFPGEPSAWEKISELAAATGPGGAGVKPNAWRKLFIQALSTLFRGLGNTGFTVVPGAITPNNVVVPELDFRSGGTIASLADWRRYANTLSLVKPMVQNFYNKAAAHYPWCRDLLDANWIFDACLEGMDVDRGLEFLRQLQVELVAEPLRVPDGPPLAEKLEAYLQQAPAYLPLPLYNAIDRYQDWAALNSEAAPEAREQTVDELYKLYQLDRFPEFVRYRLYRDTYFSRAAGDLAAAFDRLLAALAQEPGIPATQRLELSDVQDALEDDRDREAFSRMVFPRLVTRRRLQIIRTGEERGERLLVSTVITDKHGESFVFREPLEPREIGQLYRYFFEQQIPKTVSEQDRYFVLADANDRIVGGLCYQAMDDRTVQLDGIAVASPLKGRGMRSAIEEEFCRRMANEGMQIVRARLFSSDFFRRQGYRTDKRWGALVKFLQAEE